MPTDMSKYPKDWNTKIRPTILKRAGNRCEGCGLANGAVGVRNPFGEFVTVPHGIEPGEYWAGRKVIKIVLTVAHLDHDAENPNPDPERLRFWCQACHNRYDVEHRAKTRAAKRNLQNERTNELEHTGRTA